MCDSTLPNSFTQQFAVTINAAPKTAKLSIDDKEVKLTSDGQLSEDGKIPLMYDIDSKIKVKGTAVGYKEAEEEFTVLDELLGKPNTFDLNLEKMKVSKMITNETQISQVLFKF